MSSKIPVDFDRFPIRRWQGVPYVLLSEPAFREGVQLLAVIPLDATPEWDEAMDCRPPYRLHGEEIREVWYEGECALVALGEGPYAQVLMATDAPPNISFAGQSVRTVQVCDGELPVELVPVSPSRGRRAQVEALEEQIASEEVMRAYELERATRLPLIEALDVALTPADLRRRRAALGLSQAALAQLLGVAPNTVYRWEAGRLTIARPWMLDAALRWLESRGPASAAQVSHATTARP